MNNMQQYNEKFRKSRRQYSNEEKRHYCMMWQASNLNKLEFCTEKNISQSALRRWLKIFTDNTETKFAPITLKEQTISQQANLITVSITLPNQLRIALSLQQYQLIPLLQELSHATAITW